MNDIRDRAECMRSTFECLDVPLGGNRTLRVGVEREEGGEPVRLHLACGFGAGPGWHPERGAGLAVPAEALDGLRDALDALSSAHESQQSRNGQA